MCVGSHAPQMTQEEQLCGGHCRAPDHAKAKFVAAVVAVMVDALEVAVVAAEVIVVLVSPGSSPGCRGVREDPFAGLRPELFVGLPFFSSDFCSGRFTKHLLVPAWAAEECVKTPSLAFGRDFSLDCRSFRRTSARAVLKNISWFQPGLQRSA